jgi:hypothetical protein
MIDESDFVFERDIASNSGTKIHEQQLELNMTYNDPVFEYINDGVPYNIVHNIPQVKYPAPSLKQYWDMLMLIRDNKNTVDKFLKDAENNFKSLNGELERLSDLRNTWCGCKPYFFYVTQRIRGVDSGTSDGGASDGGTSDGGDIDCASDGGDVGGGTSDGATSNNPTSADKPSCTYVAKFISVREAKRLYCKIFQEIIMSDDTRKALFLVTRKYCIDRNPQYKVVVTSRSIDDHTQREAFISDDLNFRWDRCLVEMIIHYPNLGGCIWNRYD